MKNKKLSESTLEELQQSYKTLKGILIAFAIIMTIACGGIIFLSIKNQSFGLIAIIPACFITLLPIASNLSQISKEIKDRELK